jgi:hypothetical protein
VAVQRRVTINHGLAASPSSLTDCSGTKTKESPVAAVKTKTAAAMLLLMLYPQTDTAW